MNRISLLTLCAFAVSGCVGLAVGTYGKKELVRTDFTLAGVRNQFSFTKRYRSYTKTEIIEHWGEPDDIQAHENCEILIYKEGMSWAGVGAFVGVVPVPLLVPTGTYKNRFYLQRSVAVGLIQEYGEVDRAVGYICGSNECIGSAGEKVYEPDVNAEEAISKWCGTSL